MDENVTKETLHAAEHDLESVYWLLVWMILRYTLHGRKEGDKACSNLFDTPRIDSKVSWIQQEEHFPSAEGPVFRLAEELSRRVWDQNRPSWLGAETLTHTKVLEIFERHLEADDWPTDNAARPFRLPSDNPIKESLQRQVVKRESAKRSHPSYDDDDEAFPPDASTSSHGTTAVSSGSDGPSASKKRKLGKRKGQ
jgi:hypothetical protein